MKNNKGALWHYIKNYKFNSIFIKNFSFIILTTLIPLIIIGFSMYNYYGNNLRNEIKAAKLNALSQVKNVVDKTFMESDTLSSWMLSDSDIRILLAYENVNVRDYSTYQKFKDLFRVLGVIPATNDFIDSIYIYLQNSDYVLSTRGDSMTFGEFPDQSWRSVYYDRKDKESYWVISRRVKRAFSNEYNYYLSTYRTMNQAGEEGVVVVNIDMNKLKKIIDGVEVGKERDLYILDGEGVIHYNADMTLVGKNAGEISRLKSLDLDKQGSFLFEDEDGQEQVISIHDSDYNYWKYVYVEPVGQALRESGPFYRIMVVPVLMCLVIGLIVTFLISLKVFQPIKDMVSLLDNPGEWKGLINIGDDKHFNEFKYVAGSILKSLDRTKQAEDILAERMELLRKAQGVALQSQINPHFLYNTLETINWKAMQLTKSENDVSNMITALSQLLRISLETENNLVSIATEIEHAKLYLHIQSMRYRDKIQVVWDMEEALLDCKIVKLTFQPLMENAIYHGIKPKLGKGIIAVTGRIEGDCIRIEIMDDGEGMTPEAVEKLNLSMHENYIQGDTHIGMRNVNQRLKLFFGEEYGLSVTSRYKKCTMIGIIIPVL